MSYTYEELKEMSGKSKPISGEMRPMTETELQFMEIVKSKMPQIVGEWKKYPENKPDVHKHFLVAIDTDRDWTIGFWLNNIDREWINLIGVNITPIVTHFCDVILPEVKL